MRVINMDKIKEALQFAENAKLDFKAYPNHHTYSEGEITQGSLVALRWNEDNILVLKVALEEPLLIHIGDLK